MSKKPIKLTPNQQQQIETIFKAFGGNCWVRVGDDVLYNNEEALVMMNGAKKSAGIANGGTLSWVACPMEKSGVNAPTRNIMNPCECLIA